MCICKAWKSFVLICEFCKLVNYLNKLSLDYLHSISHNDNVSIITYIAACSTKVDNTLSTRAGIAISMNVSHYIVAEFLLIFCCFLIVNIINMSLELIDLLLSNTKTKLHFSSCKSHPEPSPCGELLVSRENKLHFLACITCAEGAFITVCHN